MGWVRWLKALADRLPDDDAPAANGPPGVRRPGARKGGESYAKAWTRVLDDNRTEKPDPQSTYTWELQTDDSPGRPRPAPKAGAPARGQPTNDYDTFAWEPTEGDAADPWGLKAKAEAEPKRPAAGSGPANGNNPYDTGVFNASWTGRFDQR